MKGRRKLKTDKWMLQDQFIREARAILASRSDPGRLIRTAIQANLEEPVGMLAGVRLMPGQVS
ncbi:hypothetical protein D3M70_19355 [Pseudomonas sp. LS-2]|nr:hypothetical protein D3M70_19355 [Pseudomonas sp. LS-2]